MKPNSLNNDNDGSMVAGLPAVATHRFEVKRLVEFGLYCGLLVQVIERLETWALISRGEGREFVVLSVDVLPFVGDGREVAA